MNDFLNELADLMEKHGVTEIEPIEEDTGYTARACGIYFGLKEAPFSIELNGRIFQPDDLRQN